MFEIRTDFLIGVNVSRFERMAALHNVLHFAFHLADMQTCNGELFFKFSDSVDVELEVEFGAADCGADLSQIA